MGENLVFLIIEKIIEYSTNKFLTEVKKQVFIQNAQDKIEAFLKGYGDEIFYMEMQKYLLENNIINEMIRCCDKYIKDNKKIDLKKYTNEFYERNKEQLEYFSVRYIELFFANLFRMIFELRYELESYSSEERIVAYTKLHLNEVEKRIEKIINSLSEDINNIKKNVDDNNIFKNDKKFKFIEIYEKKMFLEDDDLNALALKDIYIEPRYKQDGRVYNDLKDYLYKFMFKQNEDNVLIVLGQPAIGKSSMLSNLAYKYRYRNDIIILQMKHLDGNESLLNALRKELRCNDNELENKILILDGYDETKIVKEKDANINKICLDFITEVQEITRKERPLKIIMTIKTEFFDLRDWKDKFDNTQVIEIQNFDKEQIKKFIQEYSKIKKKKSIYNSKIIQRGLKEKKIGIIANPMMLYMICYYGEKLGENINKALVYEKIFSKNGSLFTKAYKGKGHAEDSEIIERYYHMIEGFAFNMFKNNTDDYSGDVYLQYIKDNNLKQFAGMTISAKREGVGVEFIHSSIRHYFVAEYIYTSLIEICSNKTTKKEVVLQIIDELFSVGNLENEIFEFLKYFIETREIVKLEEENKVLLDSLEYVTKRNGIYSLEARSNEVLLLDCIHNVFNNYWKIFTQIYAIIYANNKSSFLLSNLIPSKNTWKYIARLLKNGAYNKLFLKGADFEGGDLRGAVLRECDLSFANLRNVDLRGASLIGTKFCEANLQNANLNGADLCKAKFSNASLRRLKLRGSILKECDFKKAKDISEVKFSYSNITHVKNISEESLKRCFVYDEQGKMISYADL